MVENPSNPLEAASPLYGLVLAGGRGTRLGRDKGELDYHGLPQAAWGLRLLEPFCRERFVSVRPEQIDTPGYRGLPTIVDRGASAGPASGVAAALQQFPRAAWFVIAADMPLLTDAVLATLVAHRDPSVLATAYRRRGGMPEPLCAIWEPAAARATRGAGRRAGPLAAPRAGRGSGTPARTRRRRTSDERQHPRRRCADSRSAEGLGAYVKSERRTGSQTVRRVAFTVVPALP